MAADITGNNNGISRFCISSGYIDSFLNLAHSCCGNKYTIYLTFACHLGITRYNMYACFFGCFFHGSCNLFQFFHRESLFNHKSTGKIQRFCSHTCQIVDCSANRKFANISSRKKCRRYNKSICRYSHSSFRRYQYRCIICCQIIIGKMCCKYFVDQFRSLVSTCSVSHCYCFILNAHNIILFSIYFVYVQDLLIYFANRYSLLYM